jgi:hypothetical protein
MLSSTRQAVALQSHMRPLERAPLLHRINGCGATIIGTYLVRELAPAYLALYGVTFYFLPILPLRIYLVSNPCRQNEYEFHGEISLVNFGKADGWGLVRLIADSYLRFVIALAAFAITILAIAYGMPLLGRIFVFARRLLSE